MQEREGPPSANDGPSSNVGNGEQPPFYPCAAEVATKKSARRSTSKPASRRFKRKKRAPAKSCARELFVYNGQDLLGVIKIAGAGKATAYNPDGKQLGAFGSQHDAMVALDEAAVRP
jgi:hypothetical protein